jgi:mono/diheme cytochrome c family protein
VRKIITGVLAIALVGGMSVFAWKASAGDEPEGSSESAAVAGDAPAAGSECCKAGDTTPPLELVAATPKGGLHNPYNDQIDAIAEEGHHKYLSFSCNGCHGGGGGGGMCPPLTNDAWVYGASDDTLFRLVSLGSDELKKLGYKRIKQEVVVGPMPPFGEIIKTSDDLWKVLAFIRSVNPSSLKRADETPQDTTPAQ